MNTWDNMIYFLPCFHRQYAWYWEVINSVSIMIISVGRSTKLDIYNVNQFGVMT